MSVLIKEGHRVTVFCQAPNAPVSVARRDAGEVVVAAAFSGAATWSPDLRSSCNVVDVSELRQSPREILLGFANQPNVEFILVVTEPIDLPSDWMTRIRAISALRFASATLPVVKVQSGSDIDSIARSIDVHIPVPRCAEVPFGIGPAVLLSAVALRNQSDLPDAWNSWPDVLAATSCRAREQGFLNILHERLPISRKSSHTEIPGISPGDDDVFQRPLPVSLTSTFPWLTVLVDELTIGSTSSLTSSLDILDATVNGLRLLVDLRDVSRSSAHSGSGVVSLAYTNAIAAADPNVEVTVLADPGREQYLAESTARRFPVATVDDYYNGEQQPHIIFRPMQFIGESDFTSLTPIKARLAVHILDLISFANPAYFYEVEHWATARRLMRMTVNGATMLTANSQDVANELNRMVPRNLEREVVIVPNGGYRETDVSGSGTQVASSGSEPLITVPCEVHGVQCLLEDQVVLLLGNSFEHKGRVAALEVFGQALGANPNLTMVMAGTDTDNGSSHYHEFDWLTEHHDAAKRVHRYGWIPEEDRRKLISRSSAVLYPSVVEGFGLIPFEAAAHGTPALATPTGVFANIEIPVEATWPAHDLGLAASRLLALVEDPEISATVVRVFDQIAGQYTWNSAGEKLAELFWQSLALEEVGTGTTVESMRRGLIAEQAIVAHRQRSEDLATFLSRWQRLTLRYTRVRTKEKLRKARNRLRRF